MNGLRDVVVQQDRFTRTERPPGGWRPIETSWGGQFRADLHYRLTSSLWRAPSGANAATTLRY